ncbi:MAG: Ca-activated chloride channel [Acidobacteriota bacterium]|jgi:Mg-chelatase subunit ChlD|nr:Ca-activated chloride channel [Acidobacteriota bacterium]
MSPSTHKASSVSFKIFLTFSLLFYVFAGVAPAQESTSTAAAARTRYLAELGVLPASREVAVEEFVNYHRHQIGRPKAGVAVHLDVRWGNDRAGIGDDAVLQVGFSTALANDRAQLRPINLALVIDKSGSMADADKLSKVKDALLTFVSQLRERDVLSIIVFDSEAQVLMPARAVGDRESIKQLIRQIEPGSSTNIHAGLMLGYQEALKNYRRDATNRVVLLTDGIANRGVTEPERIAQDSLQFNDRGIDLSTIGVGLDLNKDLLRQLAKSGRGLFHFVADAQDITKVFIKEVQSLVSPVATEPNLEIDYDSGLELAQLYGYEPQLQRNAVRIKLDNMNSGMTQVVLLRFRLSRKAWNNSRLPVKVRLTYYDLEQKKQVVETNESFLMVKNNSTVDLLKDEEVGKNYSIAQLAQAIRDMAAAYEAGRFQEAEKLLTIAIARTYQRYPNLEDEDITRTLMIAQKYQDVLRKYNQQRQQNSKSNL